MAGNETMQFELVHGVLVGVHTDKHPSREEWERHCVLIERTRGEVRGVLIFTEGGGPSSSQRQQIRLALHDVPAPPTAILTRSAWVRGIITSLNWFLNGPIAAFEPPNLQGAIEHLRIESDSAERAAIVDTLAALARKVNVRLPQYDRMSLRAPSRERVSTR